jgi:acyl-CoA thioester hydrolase
MGVAYYANYFVWFEEGRSDFFRKLGYPYSRMEEEGFFFPVVRASCYYRNPARYDDLLTLETMVEETGRGKVAFRYTLVNSANGKIHAEGSTTHACLNRKGKLSRIPEGIRSLLMKRLASFSEMQTTDE